MKHILLKVALMLSLAAVVWAWNGKFRPTSHGDMIAAAEAVIGRPATPVSYAGGARRTTVRVAAPGVGAPGVGVAPMNRVGVR